MKSISVEKYRTVRKGYIALLSVIFISAIGVLIMLSVIVSGVDASKTDYVSQQSGQSRAMASSCAEEALQKILETGTTSSVGTLTIASGTCTYAISSVGGLHVDSTGIFGSVTSKVKVVISTTSPSIVLSSWSEVADF